MSYIARTIAPATLLILAFAVPAALLVGVGTAHAKQTPEQKCQKARYEAAAKYAACQQEAMGALYGGGKYAKFAEAVKKCTVKYAGTWPKLQKKATGTMAICDAARFVDNEDGTVTDNLTGLQWEQKTDDATVHDKDNFYAWSAGGGGFTAADGAAFTGLLAALNNGGCFAGQCDWRLPTFAELQSILLEAYPCVTHPCIDQDVFGPTTAGVYWSDTSSTGNLDSAWRVNFYDGNVSNAFKGFDFYYVRAVRGGP